MMKRTICSKTLIALSMSVALGLSACGGGGSTGGDNVGVKTGVFIDAPVKGLNYSTPSQSGVTNEKGEFSFKEGEKVAFDIDGVKLAEVDAAAVVPVTALPNPVDVARVLQTLDVDAEEGVIDISGVVLPDAVKNDLKAAIEDQTVDLDAVFDAADIQAIEGESSVDLINTDVVSVADALDHVEQSVGGSSGAAFSADDLNRQVYVDIDDGMVISFEEDGSGFEWNDGDGDGQPYRYAHQWVLANDKVTITYQTDAIDVVSASLLNKTDNRYDVLVENSEGIGLESIHKALPLSVEALDGKILNFETTGDSDCTARTIKIDGDIGKVKEQCTGGFYEDTVTLSNAASLDNTVWINGTDSDGNWKIKIHLVEGTISSGKYAFIDEPQAQVPEDVYFVNLIETDKELEDGSSTTPVKLVWTPEMSNNKTYYLADCEVNSVVEKNIMNSDGTGTYEVIVGSSANSGSFTHFIDDDGNLVITDSGEEPETVFLKEQTADYLLIKPSSEDKASRMYFEQSKASAYCLSIAPVEDFKFSTDYLNGKTLYNVYEECTADRQNGVCTGSLYWEMSVFTFSSTTFSAYEILADGSAGESLSDVSYEITSEGYISMPDFDNANDTDYIKPLEKTDDFIRLDWSSSREGINTDRFNEYFYFTEASAQAFLDSKNQ